MKSPAHDVDAILAAEQGNPKKLFARLEKVREALGEDYTGPNIYPDDDPWEIANAVAIAEENAAEVAELHERAARSAQEFLRMVKSSPITPSQAAFLRALSRMK